jgi:hypothetical protein
MSLANIPTYSGGCQCGAVRFHIEGAMGKPSICHCRMCQKAFGAFYAPLVNVRSAKLTWTRGGPRHFQSSSHVRRGFCDKCGTPLTYEAPGCVAISIGAFDRPEELAPAVQWGVEQKLPYVDGLSGLPGHHTMDDTQDAPFLHELVNYQHPDHDTETWPPEDKA